MTLPRLFTISGRSGRRAWWLGNLLFGIVQVTIYNIATVLAPAPISTSPATTVLAAAGGALSDAGGMLAVLLSLPVMWMSIALSARRWHDLDKSAWWVLVVLIPVAGPLWHLVSCGFVRGTDGANRFG